MATDPWNDLLLHTVCDEFGLRRFTPEEIDFIHNFVNVMSPLLSALNILQGEKNTFLRFLASTIVQLKNDLKGLLDESFEPTATQGLIVCRPLIQNMIQSLPAFKMDWVEDEIKRL